MPVIDSKKYVSILQSWYANAQMWMPLDREFELDPFDFESAPAAAQLESAQENDRNGDFSAFDLLEPMKTAKLSSTKQDRSKAYIQYKVHQRSISIESADSMAYHGTPSLLEDVGNAFQAANARKWWNPFWLSNTVLVSFFLLFASLFLVILALYLRSRAFDGLITASESAHFAWRYVPTAIFVVSTSLWHRVDFYCKALTPYDEMKRQPVPGSRSLLLDYIVPTIPSSLWRALKLRHWAVVISISIDILLKLSTVLSASLLILQPTIMSKQTDGLVLLSQFNAGNLELQNVGSDGVDAYYASRILGRPWIYGTTENLVVETFDTDSTIEVNGNLDDAIMKATALGVQAPMQCELATVDIKQQQEGRPWIGNGALGLMYMLADVSGADCELKNVSIGQYPTSDGYDLGAETHEWMTNYQGSFSNYICNTGFDYVSGGDPAVNQPTATSPNEYRFLLTMSQLDFYYIDQELGGSNWLIARSTGVLCKPTLDVSKYDVTLVPAQKILKSAETQPNTTTHIAGFDLEDLINGLLNNFEEAQFGSSGNPSMISPVLPAFQLLSELNGGSDQESLMEPDTLLDLSREMLQGVAVQFIQSSIKDNNVSGVQPLSGSIYLTEQRILTQATTTLLLLPILALLCVLVVFIAKWRPWNTVPCETDSLGSAAAILAASHRLRHHLRSANFDEYLVLADLKGCKYRTLIQADGSFGIEPQTAGPRGPRESFEQEPFQAKESPRNANRWWKPMATRTWSSAILIIFPLALIVIIRILQHISVQNQGITELRSTANSSLGLSYIPVMTMMLVALMQSSRSLYLSLRNRWWANSLTIFAGIVSSFLTIVASGLYSVDTVNAKQMAPVLQLDSFNLTHFNLALQDNRTGIATHLILENGLFAPMWTHNNMVFPSVQPKIPELTFGGNTSSRNAFLKLDMPALRPSLQCIVSPLQDPFTTRGAFADDKPFTYFNGFTSYNYSNPGVGAEIETSFVFPSFAFNQTNVTWDQIFTMPNSTSTSISSVAFGYASSLALFPEGNETTFQQTAYDHIGGTPELGSADVVSHIPDIDPYTPNFGLMAGIASGRMEGNATDWALDLDLVSAVCYQVLEEVLVDVTFVWPNMSISTTYPPVPDESTARMVLSNESTTTTWFMDPLDRPTSQYWWGISLNNFLDSLSNTFTDSPTIYPWFKAMEEVTGQPMLTFLGKANQENLLKGSSLLYGTYAVQAISGNMRTKTPQPGQDFVTFNATLTMPRDRVKQNESPAIVLQVLLAVIAVCNFVSYFLVSTKQIVPRSPSSIAGAMLLLARSELCNSRRVIPKGAEWWSSRERRQHRLFHDWFLSLGWWGEANKWYGIDIGKAEGRAFGYQ